MTDPNNIGLILLAIVLLFPVGIAAAWGAYQCWLIWKAGKESKRHDGLYKPMTADYLTIMNKLDNFSQKHELETIDFCIKIFKDSYGDLPNADNYLGQITQLYKVKKLEMEANAKQHDLSPGL